LFKRLPRATETCRVEGFDGCHSLVHARRCAVVDSDVAGSVYNSPRETPESREWEDRVNREVGRRVHRVVAELAASPESASPQQVLDVVRAMWLADPVGGSVASSARLRCSTASSLYLHRFMPTDWVLAGVEVRVGRAIADLVWEDASGLVVIDEVKSGAASVDDPAVADQLARLAAGGRRRWDAEFAGVRLAPLGSPGRAVFVTVDDADRLVPVGFPTGMEPR
jgi:hypothetical protein